MPVASRPNHCNTIDNMFSFHFILSLYEQILQFVSFFLLYWNVLTGLTSLLIEKCAVIMDFIVIEVLNILN